MRVTNVGHNQSNFLLKQKDEGMGLQAPFRVLKPYLWSKGNKKQEKCQTLMVSRLHPFPTQ
jgi:hypothetical protein